MIIDAHQHFWRYMAEDYGWIDDSMSRLRRNFLPPDLQREIAATGVDGVVSVQARQSLEETRWLLELAEENSSVRGVVGWVPLASADVHNVLDDLSQETKLRALRHVVQDEPDDEFILREDFNAGVALLGDYNLAYDILIFERHLPQAVRFVDRHPEQIFVLDHVAKPRIKDGAISPWREQIGQLAQRPQVYCKLSGMVTEADWGAWTAASLRPHFDAVLEAFGPGRLMYGSDWPVCLLASDYGQWLATVKGWIAELSPTEQQQILGQTAIAAYDLSVG